MRVATRACLLVAAAAAVLSLYRVTLAPPGLHARDLEIAAAPTPYSGEGPTVATAAWLPSALI